MVNDKSSFTISSSTKEEKPRADNEESRKEIIEMAAEQFASLLWQQIHFENKKINKFRE